EDVLQGEEDRREDVLQCRALGERALRNGEVAEGIRLLEKAMRLGGCPGLEDTLRAARAAAEGATTAPTPARAQEQAELNGGLVPERYAWSQTKETVELNLFVPEDAKARDVKVEVSESNLRITHNGATLLAGEWEFKVEPEEDVDWELKRCHDRRALRLLVRKAPMPGGMSVSVWWSGLLKGEPQIDVKNIEARQRDRDKSAEFKKAWTEAHAMFKEAVKNRTPIPIDLSGATQ
ncbi:Protein BOBBER 2, partial [Durusdinium trenchii]